jgi:hypothetical protein
MRFTPVVTATTATPAFIAVTILVTSAAAATILRFAPWIIFIVKKHLFHLAGRI